MKAEEIKKYYHRISKVNEIRRKYWNELRTLRNDIISKYRDKPDGQVNIIDPDAKELLQTVDDMWESGVMEEMRRHSKTHRSKTIPLCPLCSTPLKDFVPKKRGGAGGLYTSDKLCKVCGLPLSGRQRDYCSEKCRGKERSRKFRRENPEAINKSRLKYSKYCYPEE